MSGHGHGHSHGSGGCDHSDDKSGIDRGAEFSLYMKIDLDKVQCLNEQIDGSGKTVFKPWDQRLDKERVVESDADEELLFNIPFTGNVKLKGVIVIGGEDDTHPSSMKLYKNRPQMSFDDTGVEADQEFQVTPDSTGVVEYPTKVVRFSSVTHLTIYFPTNFGADTTKVYYIGLHGDFTEAQRQEILITNYEIRPNPADHKVDSFNPMSHEIQ
ncbi:PITH domain-containing protein 1 [Lingula anatina]|uniref:PITH domain-containing protein 1 n=1 Tax=Lingula anatina TaxID=7574 RepID=A0A1S3J3R3_LINAN|nr:PITH domain-containing protein 1 [Lingula anatina]|eukprot:XP_013405040.1 PITH domain-containing protein 1 [Lingula anatina]